MVGIVTVIFSDGPLSTPLESTDFTKYEYVRPASTVLSVYRVPETSPFVNFTGGVDCVSRYTLYPTTREALAVQVMVAE